MRRECGPPAGPMRGDVRRSCSSKTSRSPVVRQALPAGYRVFEARNGQEAVKVFDQHGDAIDLLLTDMRMPYMGGAELAQQLRARRLTLKLICISGYPGRHRRRPCLRLPRQAVLARRSPEQGPRGPRPQVTARDPVSCETAAVGRRVISPTGVNLPSFSQGWHFFRTADVHPWLRASVAIESREEGTYSESHEAVLFARVVPVGAALPAPTPPVEDDEAPLRARRSSPRRRRAAVRVVQRKGLGVALADDLRFTELPLLLGDVPPKWWGKAEPATR